MRLKACLFSFKTANIWAEISIWHTEFTALAMGALGMCDLS
jgi:hypothetical protein